jgi:hypothetical protein
LEVYRLPAKVLVPQVPVWYEKEKKEREQFTRDVERFLGGAVAEEARPFIELAPFAFFTEARPRIPFVETFEKLLDPHWRLKLNLISTEDLLNHAFFGGPIRWGIVLQIRRRKPRGPIRAVLLADAPWLALLHSGDSILNALIRQRLLAFRCPSETMVERLQSQVEGKALRCQAVGSGFGKGGTDT